MIHSGTRSGLLAREVIEQKEKNKRLTISRQPLLCLVAPAGLEPATKRL